MLKTETAIVRSIIGWIQSNGGDAWHVHGNPLQRVGEPDIDGWIRMAGGVVHIKCEVKVPGNKPTPLQYRRLSNYRSAGYMSVWVTSLEEFTAKLATWVALGEVE